MIEGNLTETINNNLLKSSTWVSEVYHTRRSRQFRFIFNLAMFYKNSMLCWPVREPRDPLHRHQEMKVHPSPPPQDSLIKGSMHPKDLCYSYIISCCYPRRRLFTLSWIPFEETLSPTTLPTFKNPQRLRRGKKQLAFVAEGQVLRAASWISNLTSKKDFVYLLLLLLVFWHIYG